MPPHVPVNFLDAGGMGGFSARCVAALAQCGYSPDDFGSHEHVANECTQARIRRQAYVAQQTAAGQPIDPNGPDARTAMLAQSNSSHLSQNALFQSERNNSCTNHPTAAGYHCNMAPTMPVQAFTQDSNREAPGSNHELVGENERLQNQRAGAGGAMNAGQLSINARDNAAIATGTDAKTGAPVNVPAASQARAAALASGPGGAGGGSVRGGRRQPRWRDRGRVHRGVPTGRDDAHGATDRAALRRRELWRHQGRQPGPGRQRERRAQPV
jgi:hypothetical protein